MKVTNAPVVRVLARAVILFAALSALCLLLAGCGSATATRTFGTGYISAPQAADGSPPRTSWAWTPA
jgi:hypothetical protein